MARFKKGDVVKLTIGDSMYRLNKGDVGIVVDYYTHPVVELNDLRRFEILESNLEPYTDPTSEIAQIIERSITKSDEKIPVDKFEFRYADEYGREVSHKFEQSEGDYNFIDVIASFRLFLLGVGYSQKDVDEIIREDRL